MPGPSNVIIGDKDEPIKLPQTEVKEEDIAEAQQMARYAESDEYKRVKDFLRDRIKFYQQFLPDGRKPENINVPDEVIASNWKSANLVIKELQQIIDDYDSIRNIVKDGR